MKAGPALRRSAAGCAVALALAVAAAHWYEVPKLAGYEPSIFAERDAQCSVASSAIALAVALWARRAALGAGAVASRSLLLRALIWAALTVFFLALWATQLGLFALLIAPTHALAASRLLALFSKWQSDARFERPR